MDRKTVLAIVGPIVTGLIGWFSGGEIMCKQVPAAPVVEAPKVVVPAPTVAPEPTKVTK